MASGAKLSDNVKNIYNEMKVVKGADHERLRLVIFDFLDGLIDVKESYRNSDLEGKDVFDFFKTKLVSKMCYYILYDCHFTIKETRSKQELVFVMWCPDDGAIKDKLNFSASKEVLKKALDGTKYNFEMNDPDDCGDREAFAEKLGKGELVTSLEGKPVNAPSGVRG